MSSRYLLAVIAGFFPLLSGCLEFHLKELDVEAKPKSEVEKTKEPGTVADEEELDIFDIERELF